MKCPNCQSENLSIGDPWVAPFGPYVTCEVTCNECRAELTAYYTFSRLELDK